MSSSIHQFINPRTHVSNEFSHKFLYSFAQENKFLYDSFSDVQKDKELFNKFNKYLDKRKKAALPGQKELNDLEKNIMSIDSTDTNARKALNTLSDFFYKNLDEQTNNESEQMYKLLLLEFAGLFNGPEGRIEQSFENDSVLKTALNIIENKNLFTTTISNNQITNN